MQTATREKDEGREPARRAACALLELRISEGVRQVRSTATGEVPLDAHDPLGGAGRAALAMLDDAGVVHAVQEWLSAQRDFWAAAHELTTLAADDELRGGRHQLIVDAGIRWRTQVLAQRRAALAAATRTALRAVHGRPS